MQILLFGLAGLLAIALVLFIWARMAVQRIEQAHPPHGVLLDVEGQKIHAVIAGEDKPGVPVVLIHGASGNVRDQEAGLMEGLAQHHPVIAFDRPGFGYSTRPKGAWVNPGAQAALLHKAMQKAGFEKAVIIGHSYGASLALAWAHDFPESVAGVVALSGATHPWRVKTAAYRRLLGVPVLGPAFAHLIGPLVGPVLAAKALQGTFWPEQAPDGYGDTIGVGLLFRPHTFQHDAEDVRNLNAWLQDMAQNWPKIEAPVLAIHGNRDPTTSYKINSAPLAERLPNARFEKMKGSGHMLHHTRKNEVLQLVIDFADSCDGPE